VYWSSFSFSPTLHVTSTSTTRLFFTRYPLEGSNNSLKGMKDVKPQSRSRSLKWYCVSTWKQSHKNNTSMRPKLCAFISTTTKDFTRKVKKLMLIRIQFAAIMQASWEKWLCMLVCPVRNIYNILWF
jgi:hypothetical protein